MSKLLIKLKHSVIDVILCLKYNNNHKYKTTYELSFLI